MNAALAIQSTKITTEGALVSRVRIDNRELRDVKEILEAELGKPNEQEIDGHAPGTLRVKSVRADGGPHRWRVFLEWEPNTGE
jgi:hypothetical protein